MARDNDPLAIGRAEEGARTAVDAAKDMSPGGGKQIRVLVRAVEILDALSDTPGQLGVSEISRATGLSKSTVHNLLDTLVGLGLVIADPTTRRYAIGAGATRWATAYLNSVDVAKVAQPFLEQLRDLTGETAYLFIRVGYNRVCVGQALSHHGLRRQLTVGETRSLWSAATGAVLLAALSDEEIADYLAAAEIAPLTSKTLIDPKAIHERARESQRVGWVSAFDESEVGVAGLAIGVRDYTGAIVASATTSGPTSRWNAATMAHNLPEMIDIVARISVQLGWRPDASGAQALPEATGSPAASGQRI